MDANEINAWLMSLNPMIMEIEVISEDSDEEEIETEGNTKDDDTRMD